MSKHYLWGLLLFPILVIAGLMLTLAASTQKPVSQPVGLACYVNVVPMGVPAETTWLCFRPRP